MLKGIKTLRNHELLFIVLSRRPFYAIYFKTNIPSSSHVQKVAPSFGCLVDQYEHDVFKKWASEYDTIIKLVQSDTFY